MVWLSGEVKTPPVSREIETGFLLRRLQAGQTLSMPQSRPMPAIGTKCHELRIVDKGRAWRIVYRVDTDAIVIADLFAKTTPPADYDDITRGKRSR